MNLSWRSHRHPVLLRPEIPLADAAVRALAEVARRLGRDLLISATPTDPTAAVVHTRDASDDTAGPTVRVRTDSPDRLSVSLQCPPGDVWERATAAVAEMHAELLGAALADADLDLGEAAALSRETESAVLGPLAGTRVDHGPYRSVPAQILAVARSLPDAVAVYAADGTLTYRQFTAHTAALAARIRAAAPEPDGWLLPVLVADGRALPVSWAAAMTAGIGYVPIDPRWPAQRIAHTLDLLDAPGVLCADPADVPAAHRDRAITVELAHHVSEYAYKREDEQEYGFGYGTAGPAPDNVVYGVYTSGTTGTPLCAVNLHGGLTNRLAFMNRWFGTPPAGRDVVLQNTRHTFDSAFWQLFWPLTTGGATVVPTSGEHLDLQHTIDLIDTHAVTVTDFVPAVLSALLTLLRRRPATVERLRSLRHLVVGGEQINPQDVHALRELLPGLRVSNAYGPSEAAIGMIFHEVTAEDGDHIPLGRPIDNCLAVVVDVAGRPLPPGATGEIVIGGACVGAGYHGEPHRTAQRFRRAPWSERTYRTGDFGHVDTEGRFHFGGRVDHQIKVGGVRVEPGEIENVSLACPGVRQAVALVVGSADSRELVLVATGTASDAAVLAHLRARLPRTSVPRRVVVVPEMPLSDAGKIDRRRLAAEVGRRPAGRSGSSFSATATDPVLAVLRTALRCPDFAADDDFFATGGNSLQAVTAAVELSERFGVEIGVRDLAGHPTATGLRRLIARRERDGLPSSAELVAADLSDLATLADLTSPSATRRERRGGRAPRTVLLTGATGFVGSWLLYELLERTDLTVLCLTRGRDDTHARRRLLEALSAQGLDRAARHAPYAARTTAVAGDLARPGLGLTATRWDSLADECDLIVHAGALVNLLYDYRMHREPNVLGTAEMIRLAREAGGIPLHHISTLGVLHDHALATGRPVAEDVDIAGVTPPSSGYSLSKWVAERLVRAAVDVPGTVLRLGEVMPAIDGAVPNPTALTHLLLTAFERLGSVPRATVRSDYSPVDTVARTVVEAVQDPAMPGRASHVFSPGTVHFDELADGDRVSCRRFLSLLRTAAAAGDAELAMLLAIIEHRGGGGRDDEAAVRDDEAAVRAVLENLLQDNPALFTHTNTRPKEPVGA